MYFLGGLGSASNGNNSSEVGEESISVGMVNDCSIRILIDLLHATVHQS